ncbi:MAG: glucose-6-phosphate 1-dehydrogenase [Candidatus Azotimanducaceae bacterium]|jgi:glucose-6-phosphate 1-dehydrogenase
MAQLVPVDTFDLIIFGGSGDLALRKLLPALYHRDCDNQLPEGSRIIAVSRAQMTLEAYIEAVRTALTSSLGDIDDSQLDNFCERLDYLHLDAMDHTCWSPLVDLLQGYEDRIRAIYLATPPALFGPVAQGFKANNLMTDNMRIVLEKPVGDNYESAKLINDEVGACFQENQIFRIDHYLGKETVQNLLALRFGNSLFEPLWRREVVDHVQITVAEDLGVDNRIEFYNDIGALRDMVQNHLLQLICLVAMEPPSNLNDDAVRDEKLKVLRALKPITAQLVNSNTVRAQYVDGAINGTAVPGYAQQISTPTTTETFVALKVEVDNWRWSGVPFYIRSGKRLAKKHSEIVIQFKSVPHAIFKDASYDTVPNRLSIMLQPDEGVKLTIMAKEPGPGGFDLKPVSLDLSFEETFGVRYPDAYERLLIEVLRGNPALFMRRDEIETAWRWIDDIIAGWEDSRHKLETYVAGSWGPAGSSTMLDRDGRAWQAGD